MKLRQFWSDEAGVMSVETALITVLVSLAAIGTWQNLAGTIDNTVGDSVAALNDL